MFYCSYDEFYEQQSSVMAVYPDTVRTEVKSYSRSITSYFCVKRSTQPVSNSFSHAAAYLCSVISVIPDLVDFPMDELASVLTQMSNKCL